MDNEPFSTKSFMVTDLKGNTLMMLMADSNNNINGADENKKNLKQYTTI